MRADSRWLLIALLLLSGALWPCRAAPADRAFSAATNALKDGFFSRAEVELGDFARTYTNSPLLAQAILYQAEARWSLQNYDGAFQLLSTHQSQAGKWADEYLFWIGEALFRKGEFAPAAESFAKLTREFRASSRSLQAVIDEASARMRLGDYQRVVQVFQQTNSVFQNAALTNSASELVPRGYLLLAEAQLAQKDYAGAEATLQPLSKLLLKPELSWRWQYLLCRVRLAQGRADEALAGTTNLLEQATAAAQRDLLAESIAFRASIYERLDRPGDAIAAYRQNLADGVSADRQRGALLKITELALAQNKIVLAVQALEKFLAQFPDAPVADLALLTLGELRLRQVVAGTETNRPDIAPTNSPATTNLLEQAVSAFDALVKRFPQTPLFGKTQLDLGWCYWLEDKMPECQAAFQAAVQRLPPSLDQATAYFKLADAQYRLKDFTNAAANYYAIVGRLGALPQVRADLFEPALYQTLRADLAAGQLSAATNVLTNILSSYPNGFYAGKAVLLAGQQMVFQSDPAGARAILLEFTKTATNAALLPEVELAIGRTFEQENNWPEAIARYDTWLAAHTDSPLRPRVEYYRAQANYHAGHDAIAFSECTNLVARFPTNEFAPLAQLWVADSYFRSNRWVDAEANYQMLSLNWPGSELSCQSRMMAGRCAVARQSLANASEYFTKLYHDTNCPEDLRIQALYAYGDTLMGLGDSSETNKVSNYGDAIKVFDLIARQYPSNRMAVLALGEKANCLLQWALYSHEYDSASNAYQQVIDSPLADAATRSLAKIGLGVTLEKIAEQKSEDEATASLKLALDKYLDVFYGKNLREGEEADAASVRKAGLEAGRLAEALHDWTAATNVYRRLEQMVPSMRARLEKNILKAQDHLNGSRN